MRCSLKSLLVRMEPLVRLVQSDVFVRVATGETVNGEKVLNNSSMESQVAQSSRPLHLKVAHNWDKVAHDRAAGFPGRASSTRNQLWQVAHQSFRRGRLPTAEPLQRGACYRSARLLGGIKKPPIFMGVLRGPIHGCAPAAALPLHPAPAPFYSPVVWCWVCWNEDLQ